MARSRRLRTGLVLGAAVVVAAVVGGGIAYAQGGNAPAYRTATVTRGPVSAGLDLVATIVPIHSATVGFAQAGTVAAVDVSLGSKVTAGQRVAQLDLTSLTARLTQAEATEASARQTLAEAESGQLPSSSGGGASSRAVSSSGSSAGSSGSRSSSSGSAAITSAQREVVAAQKAVDKAGTVAQGDLRAATAGCSSSGHTPDTQACLAAETTLLSAQQGLAADETTVSAAQSALSKALATASASAARATGSAPAATTPASAPVSAAALAAYQADVDADVAAVAVAQQNLDQGTAVSPISGTVVAIALTPGQTVAAASSTAVLTVSATDGYQASAVVPVASIGQVTIGERAAIVEDGNPATLTGTVVAIGSTPTASGYPVTIGLPASAPGLRQGMSASVRLTTGQISSAVVVPTSAVHTFGSRHVVEVVKGRTMTPTEVTVGVMDPLRTQVLTGVTVGQQVALADLSSTVTSDSSTSGSAGGLGGLTSGRGLGGGGRAFGGGGGFRQRGGG